jgi:hypothetical protein
MPGGKLDINQSRTFVQVQNLSVGYFGAVCIPRADTWLNCGVRAVLRVVLLLLCSSLLHAQQPFNTDDADVTEFHKWHLEAADEFDKLNPGNLPSLRQNTFNFKFAYGAFKNIELGLDNQLITIQNAPDPIQPRTAFGWGDMDFSVKWKYHEEKQGSRVPALAASLGVEFPTGDEKKQLGSGLTDYALNFIAQKSVTNTVKWRVNTGWVFAGNTLTGVIGVKTRGNVFTAATSLVRDFTSRLKLGGEVYFATTDNFNVGRSAVQMLSGGNYALRNNLTLDFAVTGGFLVGATRIGAQTGFSLNW